MSRENGEAGLGELLTQMRITNRLLAAGLRSQMKQNELVALLASTGATHREIADVLDTTPGTVKVALQRMRKKEVAIPSSNDLTAAGEAEIA